MTPTASLLTAVRRYEPPGGANSCWDSLPASRGGGPRLCDDSLGAGASIRQHSSGSWTYSNTTVSGCQHVCVIGVCVIVLHGRGRSSARCGRPSACHPQRSLTVRSLAGSSWPVWLTRPSREKRSVPACRLARGRQTGTAAAAVFVSAPAVATPSTPLSHGVGLVDPGDQLRWCSDRAAHGVVC